MSLNTLKRIRVTISAALLILSPSIYISADSAGDANIIFREGLGKYLEGNYSSAILRFVESLKSDPEHKGAKAFILKSRKKIEEERKDRERLEREEQEALRQIEVEREKEKERLSKLTEEDTPEARARLRAREYYIRGLEYLSQNNPAMALREWEMSLIWQPDNRELEKRVKSTQEELEMIARAALLENRIGEGYMYYQGGNLVEALEAWRRVIELDPGNRSAAEYIKEIQDRLSRREQRIYQARLEEKRREEIKELMEKASVSLEEKRYNEAISLFSKVLEKDSGHSQARALKSSALNTRNKKVSEILEKGIAMFERENYRQAESEFNRALQLDPKNKKAGDYISRARKAASEEELKERRVKARRMYFDAAALYMNGQYKECEDIVNNILEIDPGNENAYRLLDRLERVRQLTAR